jgi:hypothetical protein
VQGEIEEQLPQYLTGAGVARAGQFGGEKLNARP